MKIITSALVAGILAVSASPAFAAKAGSDAKEIKVGGHVFPASCIISIDNDGIFNYGHMTSADVMSHTLSDHAYVLDEKSSPFEIKCSGPTRVAISNLDARASSGTGGGSPVLLGDNGASTRMGLGIDVFGSKIGQYKFGFETANVLVDGKSGYLISQSAPDQQWNKDTSGLLQGGVNNTSLESFAVDTNTVTPLAFTDATGVLHLQAGISDGKLASNYKLDGLSIIELNYL